MLSEIKDMSDTGWVKDVIVLISLIKENDEQTMGDSLEDVKRGRTAISTGSISLTKKGGNYILNDGYHRLAEAILRGDKTIAADVKYEW
jgi:hypothetical protein